MLLAFLLVVVIACGAAGYLIAGATGAAFGTVIGALVFAVICLYLVYWLVVALGEGRR